MSKDDNMEKEPKEPKSVEIPPPAEYVNFMKVSHTENDFTFEFGQQIPDTSHAYLSVRLASSPQHTKKMLMALKTNVEKYEEVFGEIPMREEPDRAREDAP